MLKQLAIVLLGATAVFAAPPVDPPQPGDLCDMCKAVVEQISDEQTREQVEQAIDKVCDFLPHFMFDQCKDFTKEIKDQIEQIATADPSESCQQVGFCPEEPKPTPAPEPKGKNGFVCEACKWGWEAIEKSGPKPDELKEQLESICAMAPPESKDQCEQAITQIIEQYTEGIKKSPKEACEELQLCDAEPQPTTTATSAPTNSAQMIVHLFKNQFATRKQLMNNGN